MAKVEFLNNSKRFFDHTVSLAVRYMEEDPPKKDSADKEYSLIKLQMSTVSLLKAFQMIRNYLNGVSFSLGEVSTGCIEIIETATHVCYTIVDGRRVAKTTYTFRGAPKDVAPIVEYISWWKIIDSGSLGEATPIKVFGQISFLPSLVLFELGSGTLNRVDNVILDLYGFNKEDLHKLESLNRAREAARGHNIWLDIVEANTLWYEGHEPSFLATMNKKLFSL